MNGQNRNPLATAVLAVVVVFGVFVLLSVLAVPTMVGMMGSWAGFGGMMGGNYWWGWLVMLLFWALLFGGIALIVAWLFRQGHIGGGQVGGLGPNKDASLDNGRGAGTSVPSALDILKQRYARGEITKEEYEQMKSDILAD